MTRVLTWREVSQFISRRAKRYSRYLKNVLSIRPNLPGFLPDEQVDQECRRQVLDAIFRWTVKNHAHRRPVHEIDIRAVAWLLRFVYPFHPVFEELESLRLSREQIYDALRWALDDVRFELKPEGYSGVVLVAENDNFTWYFDPLTMIAPGIDENERVPFRLSMAARRIMEQAFRVACTVQEGASEDDIDDVAIRVAADQLLKVVAPLVASDDDDED
jgi:hypothetical protein